MKNALNFHNSMFDAGVAEHQALRAQSAELLSQKLGRTIEVDAVWSHVEGCYGVARLEYGEDRPDGLVDLWIGQRKWGMTTWADDPIVVARDDDAGYEAIRRHFDLDAVEVYTGAVMSPGRYGQRIADRGRESKGPRPTWINDGWCYLRR